MMKLIKNKTAFKSALLICILLMLFSSVYMYFSYNVALLINYYPHISVQKDGSAEIEIKPTRPNHWVKLSAISKYTKWAIVLSEDWAFYQHNGLDTHQIKAALNDMVEGRRFRGASTITQQMVKNVYLLDYPLWWRKFHEIILAQKVEQVLSKDRILEIYLNSIEYGPGIYGIKNASSHYFKKSPSRLTPREGAFLAFLLPSPKKYYVNFKQKKLKPYTRARLKELLRKLRIGKIISNEQYENEIRSNFSWEY